MFKITAGSVTHKVGWCYFHCKVLNFIHICTVCVCCKAILKSSAGTFLEARPRQVNMATFVNFNLGGKYFTTTKDTVLREPSSRLALVVRGILPSTRDNTDAYFIDRDAKYFQLILNYLRYYVSRHGWLQQQNKARKSGRMMDLLDTHHSCI